MSAMMENVSTITVVTRATIASVYRTTQIVASIPKFVLPKQGMSTNSITPVILHFYAKFASEFLKFLFSFKHSQRLCFIGYP